MRWETEQSFDGILCQEYYYISTKNYQNLIIGFQVAVENVGDVFFGTQCSYIVCMY